MYQHPDNDTTETPGSDEMSGVAKQGHNTRIGNIAADHLRSFIERIERLEEDKVTLSEDIRDVFAEAKGNGFCTKTIKKILKIRQLTPEQRSEENHMLDLYSRALGMTPIEEYIEAQKDAVDNPDLNVSGVTPAPAKRASEIVAVAKEVMTLINHVKEGEYTPKTDAEKGLVKKMIETGYMKRGKRFHIYVLTPAGKALIGMKVA